MTETSISLLSIISGISSALLTGYFYKKYSLGLTGNAIVGVFGSILFLKTIGRIGIDPTSIVRDGTVDIQLLCLNIAMSLLSGGFALVIISKLLIRFNQRRRTSRDRSK